VHRLWEGGVPRSNRAILTPMQFNAIGLRGNSLSSPPHLRWMTTIPLNVTAETAAAPVQRNETDNRAIAQAPAALGKVISATQPGPVVIVSRKP
jgi:hypothetical protein